MPDPTVVFATEADIRQAEYFCVELHRTIVDLDQEIAAAETAIARQARIPDLQLHTARTQRELQRTVAERARLCEMLSALGHGHPCGMHA